jgi:hypothetical protein
MHGVRTSDGKIALSQKSKVCRVRQRSLDENQSLAETQLAPCALSAPSSHSWPSTVISADLIAFPGNKAMHALR